MQLYSVVWTFLDILLQLYEFLAVTRSELDWAGQGKALKAQQGWADLSSDRRNWAGQILVQIILTGLGSVRLLKLCRLGRSRLI
jgi:hypothetical protein